MGFRSGPTLALTRALTPTLPLYYGQATSVVDEVVFGKTGADGFIHDQCLQVP